MASKVELLKHFKASGVKVSHEEILNCCVDMCGRLFIDEKELVDSWLVFSKTKLDGAEPTVSFLLQMERQEFDEKTLASADKKPAPALADLHLAVQDLVQHSTSNPD